MLKKLTTIVLAFLMYFNTVVTVNVQAYEYQPDENIKTVNVYKTEDDTDDDGIEPYADPADETPTFYITGFESSIMSGYDRYDGTNYIWSPNSDVSNKRFIYKLVLTTDSYAPGTAAPGEIEITIPASVFKDRGGNDASYIELSVPSQSEIEAAGDDLDADLYWGYKYKDSTRKEIIIYNIKDVGVAEIGENYIELAYVTNKSTFEYVDMGVHPFVAVLNYKNQSIKAPAINVQFDTKAKIVSTEKGYPNKRYISWQDEWGTAVKPANPDDYYYLVWPITSDIVANQPYTITLDDSVIGGVIPSSTPFDKQGDYTPVSDDALFVLGYRFSGQYYFSTADKVELQKFEGKRTDYVLTALKKSKFTETIKIEGYPEENAKWVIDNSIDATLHPYDNIDPDTAASGARRWTWEKPSFDYGTYGLEVFKYAGNSYYQKTQILRYDLQKFNGYDGAEIKFSEYDGFNYYTGLYLNGAGIMTAGDPSKPETYGSRKIKYVFEDTYDDKQIVLSNQERNERITLQNNDFCFYRLDYKLYLNDAVLNKETQRFEQKNATYTDDDILCFYGKFGESDEYVLFASYNYKTKAKYINDDYVASMSDESITLKETEGLHGYRVETENNHYYTRIDLHPYIKLYNSKRVMDLISSSGGIEAGTIMITNSVRGRSYFNNGSSYAEKVSEAHDQATITYERRNSSLKKNVISSSNNTIKRLFRITWKVDAYEESYANNPSIPRLPVMQASGTIYDLIPKGSVLDPKSISVFADNASVPQELYTVTTIDNYKDTGRTLLKIDINKEAGSYSATFDTVYHWNSIFDYGKYVYNPVAFETGNDSITNGRNDDGGTINEAELMSGLDPLCNGNRFIYNQFTYNINSLLTASSGLNKKAKGNKDVSYVYETSTDINSVYSYQLRFQNNSIAKAKDLVFYDNIENYKVDGTIASQWKGTLTSIDVAQLRGIGINPIVYYSSEDLDITDPAKRVLSDTTVWTVLNTYSNLDDIDIKTIAVDASKKTDGTDFILDPQKSIVVNINMIAPDESPLAGGKYPETYNSVYLSDTMLRVEDGGDTSETEVQLMHNGYTVVRLIASGSFGINKVNKDNTEERVPGITFRLFGTSSYGSLVDKKIASDSKGQIYFEDIEMGSYILQEYECSNDWLLDTTEYRVSIDNKGNVTIDGEDFTESYITIENTPRIHADIPFKKLNFTDRVTGVGNVVFEISGISDYGTEIKQYATSDGSGNVDLANIEMGTYELKEISTPEGYVNANITYRVKVDENGLFAFVSAADSDGKPVDLDNTYYFSRNNNSYQLYNEDRTHEFSFYKIDSVYNLSATPKQITLLQNASFRLHGISDLGNSVDVTLSSATGIFEFTGIEKGTYILEETVAPDFIKDDGSVSKYVLSDAKFIVTVNADNTFSIKSDSPQLVADTNVTAYYITNSKPTTEITVTKKWVNGDPDNRPIPQFRLTAEPEATASPTASTYKSSSNVLSDLSKAAESLLSVFKPVEVYAEGGDPEIDQIYYYYDTATKVLYLSHSDSTEVNGAVPAWIKYTDIKNNAFPNCENAVRVEILDKIIPSDTSYWFNYYKSLAEIKGIENLDTSNVTKMDHMFADCRVLTSLDVSNFDTRNVIKMDYMFHNCYKLESLDLSSFDTSNVTDMSGMFYTGSSSLTSLDVSNFDTSNVTNMYMMFNGLDKLTSLDVSSFNTSNVTKMDYMFSRLESIQNLDVSNLNTSNVNHMYQMFSNCKKLSSLDLSNFNTSNVIDASFMFLGCESLEQLDLSNFNTSNVSSMPGMFSGCIKLKNLDLTGFDTSKVVSMEQFFKNCKYFSTFKLPDFDTRSVTSMKEMFYGCDDVSGFDLSTLETLNVTTMKQMFATVGSGEIDLRGLDVSNVTDMSYMFAKSGCTALNLSGLNASKVTDMSYMFSDCSKLTSLDLSNFNTSKVTNMSYMFYNCESLETLNLSGMKTSNVTDMSYMFNGCKSLTSLNLSGLDTSKVSNMNSMFSGCSGFETLDLSGLDTSNVKNMTYMFSNATSLKTVLLNNFNTSEVTNMYGMFYGCSGLETLDLSSFDTQKVKDFTNMFRGCTKLKNLNVSKLRGTSATATSYMFDGCSSLVNLDLSNFDTTTKLTEVYLMFNGCNSMEYLDLSKMSIERASYTTSMYPYNLKWFRVGENYYMKNNMWPSGTWNKVRDVNGSKIINPDEKFIKQTPSSITSNPANGYSDRDPSYCAGVWMIDGASDPYTVSPTGQVTYSSVDDFWDTTNPDEWTYSFIVEDDTMDYYLYELDTVDSNGIKMSTAGYKSDNLVEGDDNLDMSAAKVRGVHVVNGVASITNTYDENDDADAGTVLPDTPPAPEYGQLKITKNVTPDGTYTDKFLFTVELTGTDDITIPSTLILDATIYSDDGTEEATSLLFKDGKANVSLGDKQSCVIDGIDVGVRYKVSEKNITSYSLKSHDNDEGTISSTLSEALFVNERKEISGISPDEKVPLTIKKETSGRATSSSSTYTITVVLENLGASKTYTISDSTTFKSDELGRASVILNLAAEDSKTLQIPVNAKYTVFEEAGDYVSSYTIEDAASKSSIVKTEGANTIKNKQLSTEAETADSGEEVTVTFLNTFKSVQNLTLTKQVVKDNGDGTTTPVSDDSTYSFEIYFSGLKEGESFDSSIGKVMFESDETANKMFDLKNGESVTFSNIPAGVLYRIIENRSDTTIASYNITDTVNVNKANDANTVLDKSLSTAQEAVDNGENAVVTFTNTIPAETVPVTAVKAYKYYSDTVNGVDLEDVISGAGFILEKVDTDDSVIKSWPTAYTDTTGYVEFEDLTPGKYVLSETTAPKGFKLADEVRFDIADDLSLVYSGEMTTDNAIKVKDDIAKGLIVINKKGELIKDNHKSDDTLTGLLVHLFEWITGDLNGVTFELYAYEDITFDSETVYTAGTLIASSKTGSDGTAGRVIFDNLLPGKYRVIESSTDGIHKLDTDYELIADLSLAFVSPEWEVKTVNDEVFNELKTLTINIVKTNEKSDPLPGVVFGLYSAKDQGIFIENELIETVKTKADGTATFNSKLSVGEYYVAEISTVEGYKLDETPHTVKLLETDTDSKTVTFTLTNYPIPVAPGPGGGDDSHGPDHIPDPPYVVPKTGVER